MCHPNQSREEPSLETPFIVPKSSKKLQKTEQTTVKEYSVSVNNGFALEIKEAIAIAKISVPMVLTGLLLYSRSLVSTLFLGRLGDSALAGGSLALGFANITGYSVLSGLAMGMEPICSQAFGAKRHSLLDLALRRTILLLLLASLPISLLWFNIKAILQFLGQDVALASEAQVFLVYSIPDLLAQSFLHPLRAYLRTQAKTLPLSICAAVGVVLHVPINFFLVSYLQLGSKGVALAGVWTNFNIVLLLLLHVIFSNKAVKEETFSGFSDDSSAGWRKLLTLAIPSCLSVCLEWWCYEIMILLCGFLLNPKSTVASMGILIQTTALIYIFPSSLSFGVSTRVGNELGSNQPDKARRAAIVGLGISFFLGFTALSFTFSVRNIWAKLFTEDEEIITLTSIALPIIGLCELGNCPQTTGCGVLRGTARPKVGANVNLVAFYAVGIPVAVAMSFGLGFGFIGLWLGMLAAQSSCVVAMMLVTCRTDWHVEAERAKELTAAGGGDVEEGKVNRDGPTECLSV
ncbi:PREDICTED: protein DETOXIFICATION 50-like [Tarenaya hassleriana]|uniref:protein DETOXIFICATION 50-like n=1 Tax=Tarenaya hassleriana TaxID=28532 RepID=UPI00053C904F|nr:PREDICTED: protein DETOXIFICATION 50-like [Tarenaya hassleriana]